MSAPQYILCIETGTDTCSVALARNGALVALRESHGERDHAARVAVYTEEVLAEAGLKAGGNEHGNGHGYGGIDRGNGNGSGGVGYSELSAVAVSKGPGSYTGLRIGVSFAKGLCYGLGIPLIGVGSLESLCAAALSDMEGGQQKSHFSSEAGICKACDGGETAVYSGVNEDFATERNAADIGLSRKIFIPMIDARRMEVYAQVFNSSGKALTSPEALIVEGSSLAEYRDREVLIFGSGAAKCREALPWARYIEVEPSARGMIPLAAAAFEAGRFEDTAYFEPFYLKDFVVTTSCKKLF